VRAAALSALGAKTPKKHPMSSRQIFPLFLSLIFHHPKNITSIHPKITFFSTRRDTIEARGAQGGERKFWLDPN
jgi:hypothetical protein